MPLSGGQILDAAENETGVPLPLEMRVPSPAEIRIAPDRRGNNWLRSVATQNKYNSLVRSKMIR
ncbi:protein of unknown function [Hyphomicrobium sp. 1Nfss2.1]